MVLYAFQGIPYFLRRPALWKEVAFPLLLTVAFGAATAFLLFSRSLPHQRDWLDDKKVPEHIAEMLAVCIVATEMFVSTVVYGVVCVDYYHDKLFVFVLKDRGLDYLLEGREHRSTAVKVCTSYYVSRFVLAVLSLPLHLVPVLGSIVYAWLHGSVLAWENHLFYFELKGFGLHQQQRWMQRHKLQYSHYGMQALLLEMIPFVGPLFIFSNTCGAALLAIKMEREGGDKWVDDEDDEALFAGKKAGVYGTV
jgi:uncharacterized protein involved in cysteine biosynthesis